MSALEPYKYLSNKDLTASFSGPPISTARLDLVSFTASWGAVAATAGSFFIEVTDDPAWEADQLRGTTNAKWTTRTIPSGSIDGTQITVAGTTITINANAGQFNLDVANMPAGAIRLSYTRSAGGGAAQLNVTAAGSGGKR